MSRYNISNVRAAFVDIKTGALTKFGIDVLQKISDVLGLPSGDLVADSINKDLYDSTNFVSFIKTEPYVQVMSSDFATSGDEEYICTSGLTVTLNDYPMDREKVSIKSTTNENVVIDGNGKTVDGNTSYTIVVQYEGINIQYFVELDEWLIL